MTRTWPSPVVSSSLGVWNLALVLVLIFAPTVCAGPLNVTIYDTHPTRVAYSPESICVQRWPSLGCEESRQPWTRIVRSDGAGGLATALRSSHRSLVSMSIDFSGSAVWIYGSPRKELRGDPVDYKVCLDAVEDTTFSECFRVNTTEAYLEATLRDGPDTPVVVFARGQLLDRDYRVTISIADPADMWSRLKPGIDFTHAVYTIQRPTPWPIEEDSWRFRNVSIYDTHPRLQFSSAELSWLDRFRETNTWFHKQWTSHDGFVKSYRVLHASYGVKNAVSVTLQAGAVAIYGPPPSLISSWPQKAPLCVRVDGGACERIDLDHAYFNTRRDESVLLWYNAALDRTRLTTISIGPDPSCGQCTQNGVFAFEKIVYQQDKEYSVPSLPTGTYQNVSKHHSDSSIQFTGNHCVRHFIWCWEWFDPWSSQYALPNFDATSYRSTLAKYRKNEIPTASFSFEGSAVYVYGAPRRAVTQRPARQLICFDNRCSQLDLEHAYMNAPRSFESPSQQVASPLSATEDSGDQEDSPALLDTSAEYSSDSDAAVLSHDPWFHPELQPVLIYHVDGLDDETRHTVELRLADDELDDPQAQMTLSKVVYTQVTYKAGSPRLPIPPPSPAPPPPVALFPHAIPWVPSSTPAPLPPIPPSYPAFLIISLLIFAHIPLLGVVYMFCMRTSVAHDRTPLLDNSSHTYGSASTPYPRSRPSPRDERLFISALLSASFQSPQGNLPHSSRCAPPPPPSVSCPQPPSYRSPSLHPRVTAHSHTTSTSCLRSHPSPRDGELSISASLFVSLQPPGGNPPSSSRRDLSPPPSVSSSQPPRPPSYRSPSPHPRAYGLASASSSSSRPSPRDGGLSISASLLVLLQPPQGNPLSSSRRAPSPPPSVPSPPPYRTPPPYDSPTSRGAETREDGSEPPPPYTAAPP